MKVFRMTSIWGWNKSAPPIALLTKSNNKSFKWSREWKSNPNLSVTSTKISKVLERRRLASEVSQTHTSGGMHSSPSKEMANSTLVFPGTSLELCSHRFRCFSYSILPSQSFTVTFISSTTITSSGMPCTSNTAQTDLCILIRLSLDWHELL